MSETAIGTVLAGIDTLAIAVSGGVDSMTLAYLANRVAPTPPLMIHAASPAVPKEATARIRRYAREHGWQLEVVDAGELQDPRYLANPHDRCFYCKTDLYGTIRRLTDRPIASGANLDDLGDYRPGLKAAAEHGVRHPWIEAGIGKQDIRRIAAVARPARSGRAAVLALPLEPDRDRHPGDGGRACGHRPAGARAARRVGTRDAALPPARSA